MISERKNAATAKAKPTAAKNAAGFSATPKTLMNGALSRFPRRETLAFLGNSLLGDICDCLSLKKLGEMRDALKEQRKKQLPLVSLLAAPAEETAADYSDYKI